MALALALAGRTALITGGSAGIGRATALVIARAGAAVIVTGRRQAELDRVVADCRALGAGASAIVGDIDDLGFVRELAAQAGHADILVNNAGILKYAPVLESTDEDCAAMFRTNVVAAFAVAREIGARMVERKAGHMVFVTSLAARNVNPLGVLYGATKHALSGLAKGFRAELKAHGIKVTEVAPGMVDTAIRQKSTHPAVLKSLAGRPFGPIPPEDVADAILFALAASSKVCPDLIELRPPGA